MNQINNKDVSVKLVLPPSLVTPPGNSGKPSSDLVLRLLFLDIDGVLNSIKTYLKYGRYCDPDTDFCAVDHFAVNLVNLLCKNTNTKIVVSSTWRIGYTLDQVKNILGRLGIDKDLIIGKTDTLGPTRGDEIKRFIDDLTHFTGIGRDMLYGENLLNLEFAYADSIKVESYVIIDDIDQMLESQKNNFIKTTELEGLTLLLTIEAGKILTNDETFYLNQLQEKPNFGEDLILSMGNFPKNNIVQ